MAQQELTVFCNQKFPEESANAALAEGVERARHRLVYSKAITTSNLSAAAADPAIGGADVAFGQPDPQAVIAAEKLKWVHLTSAGYDRYDRQDVRTALRARAAALSNSSSVYEEPCAQHVLSMILAQARRLDQAFANQAGDRDWPAAAIRRQSRLLTGQRVLILSFGAIARRVVQLLSPFEMEIVAVRRRPAGDETVKAVAEADADRWLGWADHVINILPGGEATRDFISARRLRLMKEGAVFYNIGRGTTVDQDGLIEALKGGRLAAAWLDVTEPEPLPQSHPMWAAPNCHITPHTAGGHHDEFHRLVGHFLENLGRFERGEGLRDRVI